MPKLTTRIPKYRKHTASGQAVVSVDGKAVYLGKWDSPESKEAYREIVARLALRRTAVDIPSVVDGPTVLQLFEQYLSFAQQHYRKNGKPTSELGCIQHAMREVLDLYGSSAATAFGPKALKTARQGMIQRGLSRTGINANVSRIRRMFKWGVANELIPPSVLQALQSVQGLQAGRTVAVESDPVSPVPQASIDAVLGEVSRQVAAMIRLQIFTGMRPGEVVAMRLMDLDMGSEPWIYIPGSHKTEHHGRTRRVYLGPQAQEVVRPFLMRAMDAYLFSPAEAEHERRGRAVAGRNASYRVGSYRKAIRRGSQRAFPCPGGYSVEKRREWNRSHCWSPHQLRHNAATFLTAQYGIEAARVVLGHSTLAVTEVYAERDFKRAAAIMREIG